MNPPDFCASSLEDGAKLGDAYFAQRINAGKP